MTDLEKPEFPEMLAKELLELPQADCPLRHHFGPGTYVRELEIPPGVFAVGRKHKFGCVNIMLTGKMRLLVNGEIRDLAAPQIIHTPAGSQKVAYVFETVRWVTVHQNGADETDIERIEEALFEPSASYLEKQQEFLKAIEAEVAQ